MAKFVAPDLASMVDFQATVWVHELVVIRLECAIHL